MSCNCNNNGKSCGLPNQPNYNNLSKGFVTPKKNCCDCGDNDSSCKSSEIIIIDKNHLYPDKGIYLEDKPDGNQILHITVYPNDYTYVVNFKNNDNFFVTHIFIHYIEDSINNRTNVYKLYINNQKECNPIEIRVDDNLKQFNNFYIRELDNYIADPDDFKYLKGKFFKLRSMRNLEIEVSKPMNIIRMYCDDDIIKNNLKHIKHYYITSDNIIDAEDGTTYINIDVTHETLNIIHIDEEPNIININFIDNKCGDINRVYDLFLDINQPCLSTEFVFSEYIRWHKSAPNLNGGGHNEFEISLCSTNDGLYGVYAEYENNM